MNPKHDIRGNKRTNDPVAHLRYLLIVSPAYESHDWQDVYYIRGS